MKKLTQTSLSLVAVLLLSLVFVQCKDAKDAAVTKFLEIIAEQENEKCPIEMSYGMTMTKCEAEANKTLKYSFNIADEISDKATIGDHMKPALIQALKKLPQFKQIKDFEITLLYAYYNSNNKLLSEIKITPEDYNKEITGEENETKQMIDMLVATISPNLPMQIDELTTLVECKSLPENTMSYTYTVSSTLKELGADFPSNLEAQVRQMAVNTPATEKLIDAGVTLEYIYNDKDGKEIHRMKINADN